MKGKIKIGNTCVLGNPKVMTTDYGTINEAYLQLLSQVYQYPEYTPKPHVSELGDVYIPNGGETVERVGESILIGSPEDNLIFETNDPERNGIINSHNKREIEIFDAGIVSTPLMEQHSKLWGKISNPDDTINANYGYMVHHLRDTPEGISQFEWAYRSLLNDIDSRQAYMHFNRTKDQYLGCKDQPCTVFCQFLIRENTLMFFSYMRSNDLVYGTPYNLGYFNHLSKRMLTLVQKKYPHVVKRSLQHTATSLHYYKRHEKIVEKMLFGYSK